MRLSIIVPCFNEEEGISYLVSKLERVAGKLSGHFETEIIFVDDGSLDRTVKEIKKNMDGGRFSYKIVQHAVNQGLGAAQRSGFTAATGDYIVTMDSDCTYDPENIPEMMAMMTAETDVVVASPYHPLGGVSNIPPYRLFLSKNLSRIYNGVLGAQIHTYTSLFRVYRREVIQKVWFASEGFLSTAEILVDAIRQGFKIKEFPTRLHLRRYGISKIKIVKVMIEHLKFIAGLLLRGRRVKIS